MSARLLQTVQLRAECVSEPRGRSAKGRQGKGSFNIIILVVLNAHSRPLAKPDQKLDARRGKQA